MMMILSFVDRRRRTVTSNTDDSASERCRCAEPSRPAAAQRIAGVIGDKAAARDTPGKLKHLSRIVPTTKLDRGRIWKIFLKL